MQDVPKLGKVLHATADSVSDSEVHLTNGASIPFDYLVLASGSTWTDPVCSGTEATLSDRRLAQQACCTPVMVTSNMLWQCYAFPVCFEGNWFIKMTHL